MSRSSHLALLGNLNSWISPGSSSELEQSERSRARFSRCVMTPGVLEMRGILMILAEDR